MSNAKLKRRKAAGWNTGSAKDFLQLSDEEAMLVELKLSLTDAVRQSRQKHGQSQIDLAQRTLFCIAQAVFLHQAFQVGAKALDHGQIAAHIKHQPVGWQRLVGIHQTHANFLFFAL